MAIIYRDYQIDIVVKTMAALDAGHFGKNGGVLNDICTGGGKSPSQVLLCEELIARFPDLQILCLTVSPELVQQTYDALAKVFSEKELGIYCAQLNKKQVQKITVGSVGSVARNPELFKQFAAISCDETHQGLRDILEIKKGARSLRKKDETLSEEDAERQAMGQLRRFLAWHLTVQPNRALIGWSGTPERFGGLSLIGSKEECQAGKYLYSATGASITTQYLIDEGWLKPISTYIPKDQVDLSTIKVERGEFDQEELGTKFCAIENANLHVEALAKFTPLQPKNGQVLICCVNIAHIQRITTLANEHPVMQQHGFKTVALTHLTPAKERRQILHDFKHGKVKCIAFNAILQVGFDMDNRRTNHEISMILGLCPTKSGVRYRQREIGRSVRPYYARDPENEYALDERFDLSTKEGRLSSIAASPITHTLYISFDGNPREHSAVSEELKKSGKLKNHPTPTKRCPKCGGAVPIPLLVCNQTYDFDLELADGSVLKAGEMCAHQFPPPIRANEKDIHMGGIRGLDDSSVDPNIKLGIHLVDVLGVNYYRHESKAGNLSLKITYVFELKGKLEEISEYVPMGQTGRFIANRWWSLAMPNSGRTCPFTIEELLEFEEKLRQPIRLKIRKGGKGYPEVLERIYAEEVVTADA